MGMGLLRLMKLFFYSVLTKKKKKKISYFDNLNNFVHKVIVCKIKNIKTVFVVKKHFKKNKCSTQTKEIVINKTICLLTLDNIT